MSAAVDPSASLANEKRKPILTADQKTELEGYDFSFENIVFEGGGNKGMAATGAIRVLEELGYWGNFKRFGGASAGAMVTALVCVGFSSHDIEEFLCSDIQKVFLDARFGFLSLLPNMLRNYGWHPGKKIKKWFGEKIKEKMKNPDLTFEELYLETGRELCVTVTGMNSMDCEYCHVKTTPDLSIREAVQMSACIPGVFCPVKRKNQSGKKKDYFVDGGLLCNYPLHCYDGWYLSMGPNDTFLQKLQQIDDLPRLWDPKERFGTKNDKTLGVLLYAGGEREVMKNNLKKRFTEYVKEAEILPYPKTKLAKKYADKMKKQEERVNEHHALVRAMSRFISVLVECDIDHSGTISPEEFDKAMNQNTEEFTEEDKRHIFGDDFSDTKSLFKRLDTTADNKITFRELISFAERKGLKIMDLFRGYKRQEINGLRSYFGTIMDCLLLNMKRIFVQGTDIDRTIGIDTGYIDTLDFNMEKQDQEYVIEQGKLSCIAFLRELIDQKKMVKIHT